MPITLEDDFMFRLGGVIVLLLVLVAAAFPQAQPDEKLNFGAAGVSFSPGADPAIAGTAAYARRLNANTFSFTLMDAIPMREVPNAISTQVGTGILQRVGTIGRVDVYIPVAAGISWSGTNSRWSWTGGAMAAFKIPKLDIYAYPNVRWSLIDVAPGVSGYQPTYGVLFGGPW